MKEIIEKYKDIVVQISTPYGSGSGFYLAKENLIITNRHVVEGCHEVVINSASLKKTLTSVLYMDPAHDVAFLELPKEHDMGSIEVHEEEVVAGESILAIGHPLGLKFTATQGIVSKAQRKFNNIDYIQVDAAINPGNSGGPLINQEGNIVGVNTFIYRDSDGLGFALPSKTLLEIIAEYKSKERTEFSLKCSSCGNIVTKSESPDNYCSHCGAKLPENDMHPKEYIPAGSSKLLEGILTSINKDVRLARIGTTSWEIEEGSAKIRINADQNTRFIYADAFLCRLPKENINNLYEFLLKENYDLEGLVFSVSQQNIILSSVVHEEDLSEETGIELYGELFKKADHYDNILVDEYKALALDHED